MKLFGVAHHAPIYVRSMLAGAYKLRGKTPKKSWVLPVGGSVKTKAALTAGSILILRYADLLANLETLNSPKFQGKTVFVFCSVVRLQDLMGVQVLDNDRIQDCTFRLTGLSKHDLAHCLFNVKDEGGVVGRKAVEFLPQLVKDMVKGSLLNPLLTILYQLPLVQQAAARTKIFEWMADEQPIDVLAKQLAGLSKLGNTPVPQTLVDGLLEIVGSKIGREYKKAVGWVIARRLTKKPVAYKQLIRKFKVSAFEIKYIISILVKNKKNADLIGRTVDEVFFSRPRNHHIQRAIEPKSRSKKGAAK